MMMVRQPPAHKQTDPAKAPGQIVSPVDANGTHKDKFNHDMMDDMAGFVAAPHDDRPDSAEERYLLEVLAELRRGYECDARPYINRLTKILSLRPPVMVNIKKLDGDVLSIIGSQEAGRFVADCATDKYSRLIAAAPELLDALREVLKHARWRATASGAPRARAAIKMADAAIDKATRGKE